MKTFQVSQIGHTAQTILRAPDFTGTVLAVVTNAVYVTTRDDEIVWLAQPHLPAHTRGILARYDASTMRVGMDVRVADERLMIGDMAIELRDAEKWQPPTIARPGSLDAVRQRAVIARNALSKAMEREISRSARNDIFNHRNSQFATLAPHASAGVRNLIGLGEGLTPAGDDFVGGILFAAYHLQKNYPRIFDWDARIINELIEYARTQTNKISFAILRDLARGQGPEPLHDFIVALLSEEISIDLPSIITRTIAIGHSTGYEILDGVLTGIELMMNGKLN